MSTTITVDRGKTLAATRYYGGEVRGGIVRLEACSREEAIKRFGHKRIYAQGRLQDIQFKSWLEAQESAGYNLEFTGTGCIAAGTLDGGMSQSYDHSQRGFQPN